MLELFHNAHKLLLLIPLLAGPMPISLCFSHDEDLAANQDKPNSRAHLILMCLSWWVCLEILIIISLGICHLLTYPWALAVELSLFLTTLPLVWRRRLYSRRQWGAFAPLDQMEKALIFIASLLALDLAWLVLTRPVRDHDSLTYHLPTIVSWFQTGGIQVLEHLPLVKWYPYSWESLSLLFMMPFNNDILNALPNVLAWCILALGTYSIARYLGARRKDIMASILIVLGTPIVIYAVYSMHIDVAFAAFFMVSLFLSLRLRDMRPSRICPLIIATVGLMCGIKASGLIYGFIIIVFSCSLLGWRIFRERRDPSVSLFARSDISPWIAGTASLLAIGFYWYLRNMVLTGNPFGDVEIMLFGKRLFSGEISWDYLKKTEAAQVFNYKDPAHRALLIPIFRENLQQPFLAVLFLAGCSPIGLLTRKFGPYLRSLIFVLGFFALSLFLFYHTPFSGDNGGNGWQPTIHFMGPALRYGLPIFASLSIAAALGAKSIYLPGGAAVVSAAFVFYFALNRIVYHYSWEPNAFLNHVIANWVLSCVLLAIVYWGYWVWKARFWAKASGFACLLVCIFAILSWVLIPAGKEREAARPNFYGPISEFISHQMNEGETIACLSSDWSLEMYPYFGPQWDRKAVYMAAGKGETREQWTADLDSKLVDYVAVMPNVDASGAEASWLKGGDFKMVFGETIGQGVVVFERK